MTDLWKVERRLTPSRASMPQDGKRRDLEIGGVTIVAVCSIVVWLLAAWSVFPSQQARLIGTARHTFAPIILSLNASFMLVGFSAGAALGSLTVARSSAAYLGLVGATCEVAALLLLPATSPRSTAFSVKA